MNFPDFAHLSLDTKMAESPKAVIDMITGLKEKSKSTAEEEVKELKVRFRFPMFNWYDESKIAHFQQREEYFFDFQFLIYHQTG